MGKRVSGSILSALVVVVALTLGACTSALGDGQSGRPGFSKSPGGLQLLVRDGQNVITVVESYVELTGASVRVLESPPEDFAQDISDLEADASNAAVWGQWGGHPPSGWQETIYGRDYSCVVADGAWFAVNRQAAPSSAADLVDPKWASLMEVDSPLQSESSLRWIAGAGKDNAAAIRPFLEELKAAGVTLSPAADPLDAQSGEQSAAPAPGGTGPRLRVASALEPWLTVNNLGTSSRWVTMPSTCVGVDLALWSVGPQAEEFIQFLLSDEGQAALTQAGLAYPITGTAQIPSPVSVVAPAPTVEGGAPAQIPSGDAEALTDAVTDAWSATVGS